MSAIASIWDDAANISLLVKLWEARTPFAEMERKLGVSKSAICGKVGRLGLPRRDNPIKTRKTDNLMGANRPRKKMRLPPLLPPLASEMKPKPAGRPIIVKPKPVVMAPAFVGRIRECCWPMSNVGRRWTFCDAPTIPGKDYCEPHHTIGFYKPRVRGEIGDGRSDAHPDA